jgi:hypothetical protein
VTTSRLACERGASVWAWARGGHSPSSYCETLETGDPRDRSSTFRIFSGLTPTQQHHDSAGKTNDPATDPLRKPPTSIHLSLLSRAIQLSLLSVPMADNEEDLVDYDEEEVRSIRNACGTRGVTARQRLARRSRTGFGLGCSQVPLLLVGSFSHAESNVVTLLLLSLRTSPRRMPELPPKARPPRTRRRDITWRSTPPASRTFSSSRN